MSKEWMSAAFVCYRLLFEAVEERGESINGGHLGLYFASGEISGRFC